MRLLKTRFRAPEHFMGLAIKSKVPGAWVGLRIDEMPVIAAGFTQPLEENMVIALEPKRGVPVWSDGYGKYLVGN